jgi:ribosome-associated heat shock protein Hsp15
LDRQRIDKWLWYARVVRTRSAAAQLLTLGHVRRNGERVRSPSQLVRAADVITIALDRHVRILQVVGFGERRGNAVAAATLFVELTPAPEPAGDSAPSPARDAGSGRPTKRERRATDRLQGGET